MHICIMSCRFSLATTVDTCIAHQSRLFITCRFVQVSSNYNVVVDVPRNLHYLIMGEKVRYEYWINIDQFCRRARWSKL